MFPSKMKPTGRQVFDSISLVLAIAGVVLSIYFYFAQKEFKALSFIADPKRALLVSPKHLPTTRITLLEDGKPIAGDVHFVDLYLWNSGTKTIVQSEIIIPLIVNLPVGTRLLDLQPIHISRQSVTQLLATISKRSDGDAIEFRFRVLEPGDGISTSLLYEGPEDATFSLQGGITGIREITDSKQVIRQQRWFAPWKKMPFFRALAGTFLIGVAVVVVGLLWRLFSLRFFPDRAIVLRNTVLAVLLALWCFFACLSSISSFVDTWRHPEKIIEANVREYIPSELTKRSHIPQARKTRRTSAI